MKLMVPSNQTTKYTPRLTLEPTQSRLQGGKNRPVEIYDSPRRMDLASLSSPNIPANQGCLLCCCWGLFKPRTYQCYWRENVMRGQPDNVALFCGIYDWVLTNDSLSHVLFPGLFATPQCGLEGGVWEHLFSCCVSNISEYIFPLFIGTVLAAFCRWNVVLGQSGGVGSGSSGGSCDLVAENVPELNLPQQTPVVTRHGMEQCQNLEKGEEGIVCQPGLRGKISFKS